jgi:hypothetical protein
MGLWLPGMMPSNNYSVFLSAEFSKPKADGSFLTVQVNAGDTFYTEFYNHPFLITSFVFIKHKLHET